MDVFIVFVRIKFFFSWQFFFFIWYIILFYLIHIFLYYVFKLRFFFRLLARSYAFFFCYIANFRCLLGWMDLKKFRRNQRQQNVLELEDDQQNDRCALKACIYWLRCFSVLSYSPTLEWNYRTSGALY